MHRTSLAIGALITLAGLAAAIWEFLPDQPNGGNAGFLPLAASLSLAYLGALLVAHARGWTQACWAAPVPAVMALIDLVTSSFPSDWAFRNLPAFLLGSIILASLALPLTSIRRHARWRTPVLALAGSFVIAASLAGWFEQNFQPSRLGGVEVVHPATGVILFVLGTALVVLSLERAQAKNAIPAWLPIPALVICASLTLILWTELRERERVYLDTLTQNAINGLATTLRLELERQTSALDHLSRTWSRHRSLDEDERTSDAVALLKDASGSVALTWLDNRYERIWSYPRQNMVPAASTESRLTAARAARFGSPTLSSSFPSPSGGRGFVLCAELRDGEATSGYLELEFNYDRFFSALEQRLHLSSHYDCQVDVGTESVYRHTDPSTTGHPVESSTDIFGRRIRVVMTPSAATAQANRRHLPEVTLIAGFGITLLLGLGIHLARVANSHLQEARLSNQRLRDEIEERKRIEAMLKLADERLRLALDSTQIAIFEWTFPRDDLYFSPGLWTMLGYQYEPFRKNGETWLDAIHPDDRSVYKKATQAQLTGTATFAEPEYRIRDADGNWRWIYARARTVQATPQGQPLRIIGTLQDVTHRRSTEEALRISQSDTRKLSLVAAHTDNIVIIAKPDGAIEWVNGSFERVMEYRLDEVAGRSPEEFMIGPETSARTIRRIKAAMKRGVGLATDVVNYSKSGKKYHLHLEIQPVHNEEGVLENFIAIQADISSRVDTEHTLRRAKAEADAASKAKSEFLASMSHEIRTPMNGVIGMTSLLLETSLNPEQRDYVSTIRNSGEALLTIINDILDFSKIESGKMELEKMPFELAACIEDALDLFAVAATAKNIDLAYHIQGDVPPWIQGDITRLRQVMVNLVNNAVKFTPAGRISVLVKRVVAPRPVNGNDQVELEISVVDSGIGIPPERMDRLFKPFTQVDSSTTRKYGGTGLGLAICQRLCALMGGSMRVASVVGEGSTFSFRIITPAVPVPPGWGLPESPAQLNYGPVLCLTENPITRERLNDFFISWGGRAITCSNLDDALNELLADPPPIALIADSALLTTDTPFRDAVLKTDLPALLLTPPGQSASTIEVFAGRRALMPVAKPLRTSSLVRSLRKLLSPARESLPPFSPSVAEKLLGEEIPLDVLLVEDNPVNQKVGLRFLERLGYRADSAGNGLEAVNILETRPYHLVLMDLQMPEMDGLEASRQIRRRLPSERQPKIIALTANALQGDRELCLSAGMDDYITKPVKPMEIAKAIRRLFGRPNARIETEEETV